MIHLKLSFRLPVSQRTPDSNEAPLQRVNLQEKEKICILIQRIVLEIAQL